MSIRRELFIPLCALTLWMQSASAQSGLCDPWTKNPDPAWEGFFMAADPCVIRYQALYRLYHTGFLSEPDRSLIAMAVSPDALTWDWATETDPENPVSIALDGRPGEWDEWLETVHVMGVGDELWMFYTGYIPDPGKFVNPYEIGLAKSVDGIHWSRASAEPVLRLADSGPDNGAMTSPAVVEWQGTFYMIYLGWELDAQGGLKNFRISGATSTDPDGLIWTRSPHAVLQVPIDDMPWVDAAVEPTLLQARDGLFYLFITADDEDSQTSPSNIAVLQSDHPFGPWVGCPDPILTMTEAWEDVEIIAPHVLEDDGLLRMWYHGLTLSDPDTGERYRVGYAQTPFPACGRADLNGDGAINSQDFLLFLNAWSAQDPLADWNNDGSINTQDFLAYLADWAAGC